MRNLERGQIENLGYAGCGNDIHRNTVTTTKVLNSFYIAVRDDDISVGPHLVNEGFWEAWISSWLTKNISDGWSFVDIGANCGYYTMLAEKLVDDDAVVISYEPNPNYVDLLKETKKANEAKFFLRQMAISDKLQLVTLTVPGRYHGSASIVDNFVGWDTETFEVPCVTLDDEYGVYIPEDNYVVKIDAEGAEELVWRGGKRFFNDEHGRILLLEWSPGKYSDQFLDELESWGAVAVVDFSGGESPVSREFIEAQTDWVMLVVRKKYS